MKVNSRAKVANLNSDEVDGKSAGEIGVNGLERVSSVSASNSDSPKTLLARCPTGKVVVGSGYDIVGGKSGASPNQETDVVVEQITPFSSSVPVTAFEEEPTSADWSVIAIAICATAP